MMAPRKAVTVRIPEARPRRVMRIRKSKSQSELINSLLEEEDERLSSHRVIRDTHATAKPMEVDDRLTARQSQ